MTLRELIEELENNSEGYKVTALDIEVDSMPYVAYIKKTEEENKTVLKPKAVYIKG